MQPLTEAPTQPAPLCCATHPDVETYLRCGKCDKPICPRCMIQTPVGARCRDCAQLRRSPIYNVSTKEYTRAVAAGLASGVAIGAVWSFVIGTGLLFGALAALMAGTAAGEAVSRAANRRRGPGLQAIAVGAVVVAFVVAVFGPVLLAAFSVNNPQVFGRAWSVALRSLTGNSFVLVMGALAAYIAFRRID